MSRNATVFGLLAALVVCGGWAMAEPVRTAYDDDGMVTINGQRTAIIGTYYEAKSDDPLGELAKSGFNLVHSNGSQEKLDQAKALGLYTWVTVGTLDPADKEASGKKVVDAVNKVKSHPAVAFLETVDEPAWTWNKADIRIPAELLVEAYPLIKQADPNHLLYTNHAPVNLVKTLQAYNGGTDIVAMDIYPVNPGGLRSMYALFPDGHQGDFLNEHISQVGRYVDKMRQVAGPNRPVFMVLQAFAWEALADKTGINEQREEKMVFPTYSQTRFMAFQSFIKGANGIIYWGSDFTPQPSQMWTDLKSVVREVADLQGPLAARTSSIPLTLDYVEMGHSIDEGVQWRAKEYDGKLYLFTCNADKNICKATFAGLDGWKTCTVLNEKRTLPVENNAVTDVWNRFTVHVYELTK